MKLNLGQKIDRVQEHFENIQKQFEDLKKAIQDLKEDMVTKDLFQKLEERAALLEKDGRPDKQMSWMNQQVNRLDPANKQLALKGFFVYKTSKLCFDSECQKQYLYQFVSSVP